MQKGLSHKVVGKCNIVIFTNNETKYFLKKIMSSLLGVTKKLS
jgi:hypothetical protein